ncbi:MAG: hypothetical protein EXS05_03990 [Planctomycetaceae bacterium]|nr:hypothetical protein [Planctomycetaceae bacterium]
MDFSVTSLFHRSYQGLTDDQRQKIDAAIACFEDSPYHPFPKKLGVHKLGGVSGTPRNPGDKRPDVWEFHATDNLIITFQYGRNEVLFRNCGIHKDVLQSP